MNGLTLFEDAGFANLLPVVYWRTVFEVRCGRGSLADCQRKSFTTPTTGLWTRAWIAEVAAERFDLPVNASVKAGDVLVNARWLPDETVTFPAGPAIGRCDNEIAFVVCDEELAQKLGPGDFLDPAGKMDILGLAPLKNVGGKMVCYPWDLISKSKEFLVEQWDGACACVEGDVHESVVIVSRENVRIERDAKIHPLAVIDASEGPVVIESGVVVKSHAYIVGPAHIARDTVINAHACLHGGVSIGPVCKIGGEVDACIFQGYTNKQHDGFLGHSYVGCWVNLGAGTTNSDLKNTYGAVRMPINGEMIDTGEMFVGAVIGDHSKTAIGTIIPTGAVIGTGVNVSSSRMLPTFMRSFTWMTDKIVDEGDVNRLEKTAETTMRRRGVALSEAERALFDKLPQVVAYFEPALVTRKKTVFEVARAASENQDPPKERPVLR